MGRQVDELSVSLATRHLCHIIVLLANTLMMMMMMMMTMTRNQDFDPSDLFSFVDCQAQDSI